LGQYVYTVLCMTMILDSEKLNPQYNQNSVLTMPWIAWGDPADPPPPHLATGLMHDVMCRNVGGVYWLQESWKAETIIMTEPKS